MSCAELTLSLTLDCGLRDAQTLLNRLVSYRMWPLAEIDATVEDAIHCGLVV